MSFADATLVLSVGETVEEVGNVAIGLFDHLPTPRWPIPPSVPMKRCVKPIRREFVKFKTVRSNNGIVRVGNELNAPVTMKVKAIGCVENFPGIAAGRTAIVVPPLHWTTRCYFGKACHGTLVVRSFGSWLFVFIRRGV